METPLTEDALLGGRVRLLQPRRGYRVAIDAVLLAAATPAKARDSVLDLGAGAGAVGLCRAARVPQCRVTCLDLQPNLTALAHQNVETNGMAGRVLVLTH